MIRSACLVSLCSFGLIKWEKSGVDKKSAGDNRYHMRFTSLKTAPKIHTINKMDNTRGFSITNGRHHHMPCIIGFHGYIHPGENGNCGTSKKHTEKSLAGPWSWSTGGRTSTGLTEVMGSAVIGRGTREWNEYERNEWATHQSRRNRKCGDVIFLE